MRRARSPRARGLALAAAGSLALLTGCGERESAPASCLAATRGQVLAALRGAPDAARLPGGALLSECVDGAENDAELQTLGMTFVGVADRLAERARTDPRAAFRLGFLMGAAQRGAGPTGGTQGELVERLEASVSFRIVDAARQADVLRGIEAGSRSG